MGAAVSKPLDTHTEGFADQQHGIASKPAQQTSSMPMQITISLQPAEAAGPATIAKSASQKASKLPNQQDASSSGLTAGQQAVLMWDCHPGNDKDKGLSTPNAMNQQSKASIPTNLASTGLTKHMLQQPAATARKCGTSEVFSDMHPVSWGAVTSDAAAGIAALSNSSNSGSSSSSLDSRSFTNDDTIPWRGMPDLIGEHELSDYDDTSAGAVPAEPAVPAGPLTVQLPLLQLSAAAQAGKLMIHPASGNTPDQVVWVLSKQQLLPLVTSHPTTQAAVTSTTNSSSSGTSSPPVSAPAALQLASPSFMLPCQLSTSGSSGSSGSSGGNMNAGTESATVTNHGASEWCLTLHPCTTPSSMSDGANGSSWQLSLHLCGPVSKLLPTQPVAAAAGLAQAPAGSAAKQQQQQHVLCFGWVAALFGSSAAAGNLTGAGYHVTLQQGADTKELPLTVRLAATDSSRSSTTAHASSISTAAATVISSSSVSAADADGQQAIICVPDQPQGSRAETSSSSSSTDSSSSGSSEELHIIVSFSHVQLVPAGNSSSIAATLSLQQQQQQQVGPSQHSSPAGPARSTSSSVSVSTSVKQTENSSSSTTTPTASSSLPSAAAAAAAAAAANTISSSSVSGGTIPRSVHGVRHLEAVLLSHSPRLLVIDGFFDAALCNGLMALAKDKLVRSRVASGSETPSRTSWSHFFVKDAAKQALIMAAEAQVEGLFNCPAVRGPYRPLAKVEALQVVKYHVGEFYHEHYDNRADSPLTRAATIIVYLCDTAAGGATSFPRAIINFPDRAADWALPPRVSMGPGARGVKVFPVQGRAVVFWSKRPDGQEDPNSIHAADTVEKGEKWIATRWMKDA